MVPIVSICGGEPLIYRDLQALVAEIVARRKHVYLCTNGLLLAKRLPLLRPSSRLFINLHLDGMEATHDQAVGRQGVFAKAIEGIRAAKQAGFQVCTNTTVYQQTDMHEIAVLFEFLSQLDVDGFMLSPAYGYQSVQEANPGGGEPIFMTRDQIRVKFREAERLLAGFRPVASPIYREFLTGQRERKCAAWANPTRNVRGWKGPCYLITDTHYPSYRELIDSTTGTSSVRAKIPAARIAYALRFRAGRRAHGQPPPARHAPHGHLADDLIAGSPPSFAQRGTGP